MCRDQGPASRPALGQRKALAQGPEHRVYMYKRVHRGAVFREPPPSLLFTPPPVPVHWFTSARPRLRLSRLHSSSSAQLVAHVRGLSCRSAAPPAVATRTRQQRNSYATARAFILPSFRRPNAFEQARGGALPGSGTCREREAAGSGSHRVRRGRPGCRVLGRGVRSAPG